MDSPEQSGVPHKGGRAPTWWLLYPLFGLEVTDEELGLDNPMFGDGTVFSKQRAEKVISKLPANDDPERIADRDKTALWILTHAAFDERFHSFLGIRRQGKRPTRPPHTWEVIEEGTSRAYELSSLLTLTFLANNHDPRTCGLAEQLHRASGSIMAFDFASGSYVFQSRGLWSLAIRDPKHVIKMTRAELMRVLSHQDLCPLMEAVAVQQSKLSKSLRKVLTQSAVRLSSAVHSNTGASQLLGAVTSLEILVTSEAVDNYEVIKSRVSALIGAQQAQDLGIDSILAARHRYVHRGEDPRGFRLPLSAIALALLALMRGAEAAVHFEHRAAFVDYLDFLTKAESAARFLSENDRTTLSSLVKHRREPSLLPFFATVVEKLRSEARP